MADACINYTLTWVDGEFIRKDNGVLQNDVNCSYTENYIPVVKGQKIKVVLGLDNSIANIAVYDSGKVYLEGISIGTGEYTVEQDGYLRFSTDNRRSETHEAYSSEYADINGNTKILKEVTEETPINYNLTWVNGEFYDLLTGNLRTASYCSYAPDYIPVVKGQKIVTTLGSSSGMSNIAIYDKGKTFISGICAQNASYEVEQDGYLRFSCDNRYSKLREIYTKEYIKIKNNQADLLYFNNDSQDYIVDNDKENIFKPSGYFLDHKYKGAVSPNRRFLACGFDDFRDQDFTWVSPLFIKYGYKSTFNEILLREGSELSIIDKIKTDTILFSGHELGDHTIQHQMYPYFSPLFNGVDNGDISGQMPFPSNDDMRNDRGDGKNAFGHPLTDTVNLGYGTPTFTSTWGTMTDDECQLVRTIYSVYADEQYGLLLDNLSNKYLGTTGRSKDSWDVATGKFTGGIFTGCETSENHEIWERILAIDQIIFRNGLSANQNMTCWSLPGSKNSIQCYFENEGAKYYNRECTQLANDLARFTSSLNGKNRSWVDVLYDYGYKIAHDNNYPGRFDARNPSEFNVQLFFNANLSRKDALANTSSRETGMFGSSPSHYDRIFFAGSKDYAKKMYEEVDGEFYQTIERLRHVTASGRIAESVWDSEDNFNERVYWEGILQFCRKVGIEVITKSEGYDIAFNHPIEYGNLIYNPRFINSAKLCFPDSPNVPNNPDGYKGDCSSCNELGVNILTINGYTEYRHYGIPYGNIKYSAEIKGAGTIKVFEIKNKSWFTGHENNAIATKTISNDDYAPVDIDMYIKDNPMEEYEQVNAGLGEKIIGIVFTYNTTSEMKIKNINLYKK